MSHEQRAAIRQGPRTSSVDSGCSGCKGPLLGAASPGLVIGVAAAPAAGAMPGFDVAK